MEDEMAELTERREQLYRDLDRRFGPVENVGRDGLDIPESSGARTDVIEEVFP
jgi:hypothetical protein